MIDVLLVLSYRPGLPGGDLADRLELSVALTPQGQLDETAAPPWPARRVLPDGRLWQGELARSETGWALRGPGGEDAPLWDLDGKIFRPGEYVTLRQPDGEQLIFRIVDVRG